MAETTELTNDLLKRVMPDMLVVRDTYINIDQVFKVGIYPSPGPNIQGTYPTVGKGGWSYGTLMVIMGRYGTIQILISEHGEIAIRSYVNNAWRNWSVLACVS